MNRFAGFKFLFAVFAFFCLISTGWAQDMSVVAKAEATAARLRIDLTKASDSLTGPINALEDLTDVRASIEKIRTSAFTAADELTPPSNEIADRLKQLGPPPEVGGESPTITLERTNLETSKTRIDAAQKKLELLAVEAEQLSARAATLQRDRFFQRVFESDRSILNPKLWLDGLASLSLFGQRFASLILVWWGEAIGIVGLAGLIGLLFFTLALSLTSIGTRSWILRRLEPNISDKPPSNFDRLLRVAKRTIINAAVTVTAMVTLILVLRASGILTERFGNFLRSAMDAWLVYVVMRTFVQSVLAPNLSNWRLPDLNDDTAAGLSRLAAFATIIFSVDMFMRDMFDVLFLPLQFSVAHSAAVASLLCLVLLWVLTTGHRLRDEESDQLDWRGKAVYFTWTTRLLQAMWLVLFFAVGALLLGYIALGHFITTQLISTGVLVSAFYIIHMMADELILTGLRRNTPTGRFLRQNMSLSEKAIEKLSVAFGTLADLVVVFVGLPLIFLQWAVTWVDLRSWLTTAFFGFKVGGITISPSLLFLALGVMFFGILLTKVLTGWLDRRVLARTELDKGVRDSVRKAVGYSGYFLAAVVALTSAGVDFSNVAIIAGALGVGIGFGLQSIVNNFVSGLILLAERPVKVGDWIVLGSGEGFVKRINVRATEIETFDGASVIVPNSSLISEPVRNWTHDNTRGKMIIPVNASRDEDPDAVKQALLNCANAHEAISQLPEPWVVLSRFGDYAHEFQLHFFVDDVTSGVFISSEVRFAIVREFSEKGLRFAYPHSRVERINEEPEEKPKRAQRAPRKAVKRRR